MMASEIKTRWFQLPDECFEALTFGDLTIGQKFITLPCPGDNSGHGGFKGSHCIFEKTKDRVDGFHPDYPNGEAINIARQIPSRFPLSMPVILLE